MVSFMNDPTDNYLDRLIKMAGLEADVNIVVPHALIALLSLKKIITSLIRLNELQNLLPNK